MFNILAIFSVFSKIRDFIWQIALLVAAVAIIIAFIKYPNARIYLGVAFLVILGVGAIFSGVCLNKYYSAEGGIIGSIQEWVNPTQVKIVDGITFDFKSIEMRAAGGDVYRATTSTTDIVEVPAGSSYALLVNNLPCNIKTEDSTSDHLIADYVHTFYDEDKQEITTDVLTIRIAFNSLNTSVSLTTLGGEQCSKLWNEFFNKNGFTLTLTTDRFVSDSDISFGTGDNSNYAFAKFIDAEETIVQVCSVGTILELPTKEDISFKGWQVNNEFVNSPYTLINNTEFTAVYGNISSYSKTYTGLKDTYVFEDEKQACTTFKLFENKDLIIQNLSFKINSYYFNNTLNIPFESFGNIYTLTDEYEGRIMGLYSVPNLKYSNGNEVYYSIKFESVEDGYLFSIYDRFGGYEGKYPYFLVDSITIDIEFKENNQNRFDFYVDNEVYTTLYVAKGETITFPKIPEKEGYTILGWKVQVGNEFLYLTELTAGVKDCKINAEYKRIVTDVVNVDFSNIEYKSIPTESKGTNNLDGYYVVLTPFDYNCNYYAIIDLGEYADYEILNFKFNNNSGTSYISNLDVVNCSCEIQVLKQSYGSNFGHVMSDRVYYQAVAGEGKFYLVIMSETNNSPVLNNFECSFEYV